MRLTINLDMDNAAFYDNDPIEEVRHCLEKVAGKLSQLPIDTTHYQNVHDSNGNLTGNYRVHNDGATYNETDGN
jgi:hypothetical protein